MGDEHHHHEHMVHNHRDVQGSTARAAIFGISDGLVSNVALIIGVAAADTGGSSVVIAGVAGLLAGAGSMAAGEYVSVKAQSELIEYEVERERESIAEKPQLETRELAALYTKRGIDKDQALQMAEAVHADPEIALEVHAREELGVDPSETGQPIAAAVSSFVAFSIGAFIPLLPWLLGEGSGALIASIVLGVLAAAGVGLALAFFTGKSKIRTVTRQVGLGGAACLLTWLIGTLLGASVS
ncbi:MAG: VIT1/CCC1 family predicted Fe2+/Mn2+ transporter [Paracrocinitomix sp.]|jgi:VIT1/CCC1 family predicted Fe2+/Mn2+ transporter